MAEIAGDSPGPGNCQPKAPVLPLAQGRHVDLAQTAGVVTGCRATNGTSLHQISMVDAVRRPDEADLLARLVALHIVAIAQQHAVRLHEFDLARQFILPPFVIGVQEGDIVAARRFDGHIARHRRPRILYRSVEPHSPVTFGNLVQHGPGIVRRVILDANQLPILVVLIQHRPHGPLQKGGRVEHGHDDGNERLSHNAKLRAGAWALHNGSSAPGVSIDRSPAHPTGRSSSSGPLLFPSGVPPASIFTRAGQ